MKKKYVKPEVYCRNYETGKIVATSAEYEKYAEIKVDKAISSGMLDILISERIVCKGK